MHNIVFMDLKLMFVTVAMGMEYSNMSTEFGKYGETSGGKILSSLAQT